MAPTVGSVRLSPQWELLVQYDGSLHLAHVEDEQRFILELGTISPEYPNFAKLAEGINMIRSRGTSAHIH